MTYKVLDLFCGAGGFSEGFRQAGCEVLAGADFDPEAISTYSLNFPGAVAICDDLSSPSDEHHAYLQGLAGTVDIIIGGPPCQGFSIAGKRDPSDPRNSLYLAYLKYVSIIRPRAVVIENVPTIRSMDGGSVANAIVADLTTLGYSVTTHTLNAAGYGVPQARRRTFFVGLLGAGTFLAPTATTLNVPITCQEAISDLPLLDDELGSDEMTYSCPPLTEYQKTMRRGSHAIWNHWAVDHKPETKRIISMVPDGGNYKSLPEDLRGTRKVNIAWTRMASNKPSFTIDAGHNHHFHYTANRVPTVRESARIQSFPDRFRFLGKKTSQFRQVGNAVPPLLAKAVAESLGEAMQGGI